MTNNLLTLQKYLALISKLYYKLTRGSKSSKLSPSKLMPHANLGSLVFGVLVGIFVTSLVVFAFSTSDITLKIPTGSTKYERAISSKQLEAEVAVQTAVIEAEQAVLTEANAIPVQEPKFDFYTELAKSNHEIVKEPTKKTQPQENKPHALAKAKTLALKSSPKTINEYLVQAGSFRRSKDADALKANLALNGLAAKIETTRTGNGETWNRVILGPFKSEQNAKDLQKELKVLEIESILLLAPIEQQRG